MKTRITAAMVFALLLLTAAPALAGWVIHEDGMAGEKMVVYIANNRIFNDTDEIATLINLEKGWIFLLNKIDKIYWGGPFETFEKEMMAALDKQIDEQMKDLPKAQREAMKKRMKEGMAGLSGAGQGVIVDRTGKTAKIAGRDCEQYTVTAGGQLREELWIAPSVRIHKEIDLDKMARQLSRLKIGGGLGGLSTSAPVLALWKRGYPLKKVSHLMGQRMVSQATKVERKLLTAKVFQVPSSFNKASLMGVLSR